MPHGCGSPPAVSVKERQRWDPWSSWLARHKSQAWCRQSQEEPAARSPCPSERPVSQKKVYIVPKEQQSSPLASTCTPTSHTHVPTTYTCIAMHRTYTQTLYMYTYRKRSFNETNLLHINRNHLFLTKINFSKLQMSFYSMNCT